MKHGLIPLEISVHLLRSVRHLDYFMLSLVYLQTPQLGIGSIIFEIEIDALQTIMHL